ncbi:MAG: nitrous oxide reductase family maturation protein NosD [Myxococcales bacterium]|nr:MAG: nitrous oxide reductase family maturation protein NosD [Myxococcales bacterium]
MKTQSNIVVFVVLLLGQCASERAVQRHSVFHDAHPDKPLACKEVRVDQDLQHVLDSVPKGQVLCLKEGVYPGPIVLRKTVVLWGHAKSVIQSTGRGTTVEIQADRTHLLGLTVDGSGGRFDTLDAAIHVKANDVRIEGCRVQHATFGILVEKVKHAVIKGNHVLGNSGAALGLRGDGIRLWEVYHSRVEDNKVAHSRDVVVWYSSNNVLKNNEVTHGRYGTHFMYSHRNRIIGNRYRNNVVGVFIMYSRDIALQRNEFWHSSGAAGMGLGIKESGNLRVKHNEFIDNTVGVYLDTSPLQIEDQNDFYDNRFKFGDVAVIFHGGERANTFKGNAFFDYQTPVRVEGGGTALNTTWRGNMFDDYVGYDMDEDGVGDIPMSYAAFRINS